MGNIYIKQKQNFKKMFKLLKAAGAAAIIEAAKDEDVCLVVGGLQFIVADIDNSKHIDRCEFSLMCIGTSGFGEVDTSEWDPKTDEGMAAWHELGKECAKHSVSFGWKDVEKACAGIEE